jgi:hypothetical protein
MQSPIKTRAPAPQFRMRVGVFIHAVIVEQSRTEGAITPPNTTTSIYISPLKLSHALQDFELDQNVSNIPSTLLLPVPHRTS